MDLKFLCLRKDSRIYYKDNLPDKQLIDISLSILNDQNIAYIQKIKDDKGRQVYICQTNNKVYYLKRYCYRKFNKIFKNIFRLPEAVRALKMFYKIKETGIPVVKPVSAVTCKLGVFVTDSILITEGFKGDELLNYFANYSYSDTTKEKVIKRIAEIWAGLYNNRIINGDPNLGSVMIDIIGNKIKMALLDMDNYRQLPYLSRKRALKNLIKFNAHSYVGFANINNKRLSTNDRISFFDEFLKAYRFSNLKMDDIHYIANETLSLLTRWDRQDAVNGECERI